MMKKRLYTLLTALVLTSSALTTSVLPSTAWALSLGDAKNSGLVGEQLNGYLGIVVQRSDVSALVTEINRKRKTAYQNKAQQAGVALQVMETRIGERLRQRAASGHYVQNANGQWRKK